MRYLIVLLLFVGCVRTDPGTYILNPDPLTAAYYAGMDGAANCKGATAVFFKAALKEGFSPSDMVFLIGQSREYDSCHIALAVLVDTEWWLLSSDESGPVPLNDIKNEWLYYAIPSHYDRRGVVDGCQTVRYVFPLPDGAVVYVGDWKEGGPPCVMKQTQRKF